MRFLILQRKKLLYNFWNRIVKFTFKWLSILLYFFVKYILQNYLQYLILNILKMYYICYTNNTIVNNTQNNFFS